MSTTISIRASCECLTDLIHDLLIFTALSTVTGIIVTSLIVAYIWPLWAVLFGICNKSEAFYCDESFIITNALCVYVFPLIYAGVHVWKNRNMNVTTNV